MALENLDLKLAVIFGDSPESSLDANDCHRNSGGGISSAILDFFRNDNSSPALNRCLLLPIAQDTRRWIQT